eukprot:COSAG05_NODE_2663_length_2787_cov_2.329241_4_plen_44_part_00
MVSAGESIHCENIHGGSTRRELVGVQVGSNMELTRYGRLASKL